MPGLAGKDAGFITLRFELNAKAEGKLIIRNTGGLGGQGLMGGSGGNGGDGQQGGRGRDGVIDCSAGLGNGVIDGDEHATPSPYREGARMKEAWSAR
jgi:hypothetical protein